MKYRPESIKRWLAFALALSMFGLSLSCMAICADHSEQSSCASDEIGVVLIGQEEECCPLNTLRSAPPERIQKTPAGIVTRPLPPAEIFGIHHRQTRNLIARVPQPASSPPLQRIPALRI
jgi:hypothetical protein